MRIFAGMVTALLFLADPSLAAPGPLNLPAPANRTYSTERPGSTYSLAIGPWKDGWVKTLQVTGDVVIESWRLPSRGGETGALMAELARQVADAGFEILFQCAQDACGGFDFRFAIAVAPEPAMHVDLGNYQYLAARKISPEGTEYLSLLVSSSPGAGFVQIVRVLPDGSDPAPTITQDTATGTTTGSPETGTVTSTMTEGATPTDTATPAAPISLPAAPPSAPIAAQLEQNGHAILSDLTFKPGSSELGAGPFPSLRELAAYLRNHPDRRVALVGHSDAQGALSGNITLSERRAASVRDRLIEEYGVPPKQLLAKGVGFLAPVASNLTDEGRALNRRVEAVLISTE